MNDSKEWDTPVILVNLERMEKNIHMMAERAKKANVALRPHTKTHKSPMIAQKQLQYGAKGITVAKLGEAEVMGSEGIDNILIAFPIVGQAKIRRLLDLSEKVNVIVSCDDPIAARPLSEAFSARGKRLPLYIDMNTGLHRCGQEPGEPTLKIIRAIASMKGIEVRGLMTHAGQAYRELDPDGVRKVARYEAESLVYTKDMARKEGIQIPILSVGTSPTSFFIEEQSGIDEMRPGSYVFGDRSLLSSGIIREEECALKIMTTVVSTPRKGMAVMDGGTKTFGNDAAIHLQGFGQVEGRSNVIIEKLTEEHGIIRVPDDVLIRIGDVLTFIPNHCCFTVNLHDELTAIRDGKLEEPIRIKARGRIR